MPAPDLSPRPNLSSWAPFAIEYNGHQFRVRVLQNDKGERLTGDQFLHVEPAADLPFGRRVVTVDDPIDAARFDSYEAASIAIRAYQADVSIPHRWITYAWVS